MKASLLQILACPVCYESLEFEGTYSDDRLVRGFLRCSNGHLYQVKDEIPIIKSQRMSRGEFVWKVEFPNLQRYEDIQEEYLSYLSEEQKEADKELMNTLAINVSEENLVLDIASGMGQLLLVLSQQLSNKNSLLGTDVDEKPLRGAKLKLEEQKRYGRVSLGVMDGKHLAIKTEKISCITSFFGFDNIPDTKKALRETFRVLKAKGRLALATLWLEEGSKSLELAENRGIGSIGTEKRLVEVFDETGFKLDSVKIFYSGKWPYNPMDRIPVEGDWFAHTLVLAHKT